MPALNADPPCVEPAVATVVPSADQLFHDALQANYVRTDRLFAVLMGVQFAAGVVIAAAVSPLAWRGASAVVHPHVWAAVGLGAALASVPAWLAVTRPGRLSTRMTVAVAQLLFSTLLTHLTGGRIETHFHVFGSLAFLALYRDWRVLVVASAVTAADHVLRGALFPLSVYGTAVASSWRWAEHAAWVAFEDAVLVVAAVRSTREMRGVAERTAALGRAEAHTRAVLETTLDAVVTFDEAGLITGWNPQAERSFGWPACDAIGRAMTDRVVGGGRQAQHARERQQFLATGHWDAIGRRIERVGRHRDGHEFPIEVSVSAIHVGTSAYTFAAFIRDVGPQRAAEAELRAARDTAEAASVAAEAASRSKSAFLANMSHEIRTPVSAVVGYADLLVDDDAAGGPPSPERAAAPEAIRRNARHLLGLISDILDLSKIEAGKMTAERIPVDLPALLADVAALMRPRATGKGLAFAVELAGPVPRTIHTDPLRLKQILVNLLGNAAKFTAAGSVTLRVACDGRQVAFAVTDTGIGLSGEQVGRLFRAFAQADESTTRKFGGTGLGLAISRRLAQLLGGDLTVASAPGVGSTFTAVVDPGDVTGTERVTALTPPAPPRAATSAAHAPDADPRLDGCRVLLAEDGEDNQLLIGLYLRRAGATLTVAENGRLGVDAARAAVAAGRPFDLVLTDMQMPELDGYGLAAELRQAGLAVPIVALTAHAMAGDRDQCLAAGCTDYLAKPVDRLALLRLAAALTAPAARPLARAA